MPVKKWIKVRVKKVIAKDAKGITLDLDRDDNYWIPKAHVDPGKYNDMGVNDQDFIISISEEAAKTIGIIGG